MDLKFCFLFWHLDFLFVRITVEFKENTPTVNCLINFNHPKEMKCESFFPALMKQYLWKSFFFLSGFSFTNIHDSQDSKGKGEGICLNPLYLLHRLHRHLDISRAITAECSHSSKDDKSIKFFVIVIKTGDFIHYLSKYLF